MKKTDNKQLFGSTRPGKLFFIAAIPGSIGMLASSIYQLMEGIMVGQFLGDTAFAAVNLAMPFVIINFAVADLIGVGSSVIISHSLGRKEYDRANNVFTCACIGIAASGAVLGAILFGLSSPLLSAMGAEGELLELGTQYLRVYALCSPITTAVFAVDNYLRICGVIRGSLIMNICMSLLCMGLEFLFLYVFKFGVWGAALATALGMMVCVIGAFIPFFAGKMSLKFVRPKFNMKDIRRTVSCGMPNFLNNVAARLTSIFMNILLLRFGGEAAISVYGVLMYADGIIQPLLYGACDSLQPAIGFNWGAGDTRRALSIEKYCFAACAILSVLFAAVLMCVPEGITRLFISSPSAEIMGMSKQALVIFACTYFVRWISFAAQAFFLAIGKSVQATILSVSVALVMPLALMGAFYPLRLYGLWINTPVTAGFVGLMAIIMLAVFFIKLKKSAPSRGGGEDVGAEKII